MNFNPNFKKFVEDYPDITLLGIGWSLYWRFASIVFVVALVVNLLTEL